MSRPFKERTRFIGEDGLWYYDCYECEMFFPEHKMGINTRDKFGIDRRCKLCKRERYERSDRKVLPRQQRPKKGEVVNRWVDSIDRTLGMRFMEYSDFEDSMSFLRIIGYDTEKDVHKQLRCNCQSCL